MITQATCVKKYEWNINSRDVHSEYQKPYNYIKQRKRLNEKKCSLSLKRPTDGHGSVNNTTRDNVEKKDR